MKLLSPLMAAALLRPLMAAAAARRTKRLDWDLEQRLAGFSQNDRCTIRAYLALNSGDQAFIRSLRKKP